MGLISHLLVIRDFNSFLLASVIKYVLSKECCVYVAVGDSTPSTPRPYDRLGAISPASSTCSSRRDDSPGADKIGTPEETPSPIRLSS